MSRVSHISESIFQQHIPKQISIKCIYMYRDFSPAWCENLNGSFYFSVIRMACEFQTDAAKYK